MAEALEEVERCRPEVVVMDVRLTDGSGIEATREIRVRHPETAVVMVSAFADPETLAGAIDAGASGYVLKATRGEELLRAVRSLASGGGSLDPAVTLPVLDQLRESGGPSLDGLLARLSSQELKVLGLLTQGDTNRQIGSALHLAEKTVKNYVSSILTKLQVRSRAEAAAYLARHRGRLGHR